MMLARYGAASNWCTYGRLACGKATCTAPVTSPYFRVTIRSRSSLQPPRHAPNSTRPRSRPSPTPPPPPTQPPPKSAYIILGTLVFAISTYASYQYISYTRTAAAAPFLAATLPPDLSDRYDHNALTFDRSVDWTERLAGLHGERRRLLAHCRGNVLEVACGTGRNAAYFPLTGGRCATITFLDRSAPMLEVAREKFGKAHGPWMGRTRWLAQSAMEGVPLPTELFALRYRSKGQGEEEKVSAPEPRKYDTVVDTMGLCSVPDPAAYLARLAELVESDGQILLLEHGRSDRAWVNRVLDDLAPAHADRHGCWWNRDIDAVVRGSGLTVVKARRRHLGTTVAYVLEKGKEEKGQEMKKEEKQEEKEETSGGWLSWRKRS